ncbi:HD-GYP domain-containing protein [Streptomyces samsunensis]|uniref:HD-GYP domain-containing protein n=1 Tax=Streptomyces malaysiensis TaxID=92644 RepID=UPI00158238B4|nr:HD-GYP domain-containing protein [Streptomyces samsunensis]NUH41157.1 HD-GYP domain-containing protein [Streptomyces samsunensis]
MRALPHGARAYVLCAVLAGGLCAAPAVRPGAAVPWATTALLAVVHAAGSRVRARWPEWCSPVLLAGAFLLPPAAAALVAVPGALLARVERPPAGMRRAWRAARLSLAVWAASCAFAALGGPRTLSALWASGDGVQVAAEQISGAQAPIDRMSDAPGFPYALAAAVAAALVLGLTATVLEGGVLVTAERRSPRAAWGGRLPGALAPYLVHGPAGLAMAVLWRSPYGPAAGLLVLLPMYVCACGFVLYRRESAAHQATIRALVQAVDIKDRYTRGHSERVGRASAMIARELGMSGERLEALRIAGILHDVGKLGVPTRLLRKNGPLTPDERRVIELHPEYGDEMVRGIGFLGEARAAILHHHERLDGSGYPYGLAGAQIPEFARVVAVADAFDAMTSTRTYSRARPVPTAVEELKRCAGSQFDPRMVGALTRALDRHGWHAAVTADAPEERGNVPAEPAPPLVRAAAPGAPDAPGEPRSTPGGGA